jgi:hypothetical protein
MTWTTWTSLRLLPASRDALLPASRDRLPFCLPVRAIAVPVSDDSMIPSRVLYQQIQKVFFFLILHPFCTCTSYQVGEPW